jgi:hypothetical protein
MTSKKTLLVAFKVEEKLARLLDQLPNKSDFIRKAIMDQLGLGQACPLCEGKGIVPPAIHEQYTSLINSAARGPCNACGTQPSPSSEPGELAPQDRARLEQFFGGGPLYCASCYQKAPACDECGWHVSDECLAEHLHRLHHEKQ